MTEVHLRLTGGPEPRVLKVADQFRVKPSAALMGDLKALLGPSAISA
jgi:DNA polymerase-3 subunit alpha